MSTITLVRGKKGLIGLYLDGELVATHDKFSKPWEVDQGCIQHGGEGCTVVEKEGTFFKHDQIPTELEEADTEKDTDEGVAELVRTLGSIRDIKQAKAECIGEDCPGCSVCAKVKGA